MLALALASRYQSTRASCLLEVSNKRLALDFDLVVTLRLMEYDEKIRFDSLKATAAMQGIDVGEMEYGEESSSSKGKKTQETQYW